MAPWSQRRASVLVRLGLCAGALLALLAGCDPAPLPEGVSGRMAFVSEEHTQVLGVSVSVRRGLYVLDLDAPEASRFAVPPGDDLLSNPTWSPSGERLMLHRMSYDGDRGHVRRIVLVDVANLDAQGLFLDGWVGRSPAWSPDGREVAFEKGGAIHLYDVETRQRIEVLEAPGTLLDPTWSPDGRSLAFAYRPDSGATGGIATLNIDDGAFAQLTSHGADRSPAWSVEGRMAFVREGDVYVLEGDGSQVTRLTYDGQSSSPTWSPDGRQMAFVSSRAGECGRWFADRPPFCTNALYVMEADGSDVRLLRQEDEQIHDPVWGR